MRILQDSERDCVGNCAGFVILSGSEGSPTSSLITQFKLRDPSFDCEIPRSARNDREEWRSSIAAVLLPAYECWP